MAAAPDTAEPHPGSRSVRWLRTWVCSQTRQGLRGVKPPGPMAPLDRPGPRVVEAVFFGSSAMKSRSWKLTCWFWLYRQTRGLRWFVALV